MATADHQVTIAIDDENRELLIPEELIDRLSEASDDPVDVVTDVLLMAFAGRAHALVHHTDGEPDEELEAAESAILDRFEERFGVSYGEATGHSH